MHNKLHYFMRFPAKKDIMYLEQKDTHTYFLEVPGRGFCLLSLERENRPIHAVRKRRQKGAKKSKALPWGSLERALKSCLM